MLRPKSFALVADGVHSLTDAATDIFVLIIARTSYAAASIASKEWIYRFTLAAAKRLNSSLLRANAWHSRSDALSSVAVLIGIVGAQFGVV